MKTLFELLAAKTNEENKTIDDVAFITVGGIGLHKDHFWEISKRIEVKVEDLDDEFRVVYSDGTWLSKHYSRDGSVRLKYHKCPEKPMAIIVYPTQKDFLDKCISIMV